MSDVIIPYRFLVRAGTAAAVAALNEIPLSRELVFETDTLKFKLGNGVDHYLDLDYVGGSADITIAGALLVGHADSSGDVSSIELPPGTNGQVLTIVAGMPTWGSGGSGDVVGPASAVNNHVAFFDGTSGKLIKDSGLSLSGTNTGDQTSVTGNAGTATALQTSRNIDGVAFNGTVDITVIAPATHAATSKTTPVDNDELPLADSAASFVLKRLTWANVKATLKTYFDTLYSAVGGTAIVPVTDVFTSNGTYTPPAGATRCRVLCIGAGGGGGSGRKGAAGSNRFGGGGGGSGGRSEAEFRISDLTATVAVTVGIGSAGGASQTTNSSNGNNGAASGLRDSLFGPYLLATGGGQGGGGQATVGVGGAPGTGWASAGVIGGAGQFGTGSVGGRSTYASGSGAGGGGVPAGNTANPGGVGGVEPTFHPGALVGGTAGLAVGPTAGGNGNAYAGPRLGTGGGGGASSITGNATAGGNGGGYGAGGGGGGAAVDSVGNSGAGGNGADGAVIVVSW